MNLLLLAVAKPLFTLSFVAGFASFRSTEAIEVDAVEVRERLEAPAPPEARVGAAIGRLVPAQPAAEEEKEDEAAEPEDGPAK